MADFTDSFWGFYITALTLLGIIGCVVLLWSQSVHKIEISKDAPEKQIGSTGHVWDEDLTELNTPMPRWWIWLFCITIVFGLVYLFLYPGLGSYAGKLQWNSDKAYHEELSQAEAQYGPLFNTYLKQDLKVVAADPEAKRMGERLFLTYCAQCHGSDARGSKGFPNLTDKDWLYGGDPETIKTTIMHGRNGLMPPMGAILGSDSDVENMAHYVLTLSGSAADPIKAARGKPKFVNCMGCHGSNGAGNQLLGAPNLTDKIWLFGGSKETIMESIRQGRSNTMPAFDDFLGEGKVHVLAAYVWGLSNSTNNAEQK